ncbi:MAG: hypothetical protein JWR47_3224 [Phenylobacterium sp.]|nr:hypothetical protein [Phenylobacterium sp.]MDB5436967.1 hypothetical protein [Phenylobacterium sp.]MDB5462279.1 hypothetical protein [Phenylobacterium sp.]MDB5496151.1 hypothetical protein [Phenylobacterium sp.]
MVLTILGVLMILMGGIWTLQGFNILPGSFMTGDLKWAIYGSVLSLAGIALIVWSRRRPAP